jgi:hypothetical protein
MRIFLAEKDLKVPLVAVDVGTGEQYSEAWRAINPRRVVPTLVLEDGTTIGEVPAHHALSRRSFSRQTSAGCHARGQGPGRKVGAVTELEGFAAVTEGVRNKIAGLRGRTIAGPYDYEQIPSKAQAIQRGEWQVSIR